ncbi:hypothetical protein D3C84_1193530 [compost metagenome]
MRNRLVTQRRVDDEFGGRKPAVLDSQPTLTIDILSERLQHDGIKALSPYGIDNGRYCCRHTLMIMKDFTHEDL